MAIAQSMPAQPALAAAPLRVSAPALSMQTASHSALAASAAPRAAASRGPEINRERVENEARAKISWGDAPEEVIKYAMIEGFTYQEASVMVNEMFKERAKTIRKNGIVKVFVGIGCVFVPIVSLVIFLSMGYIPLKIFAVTVMIGLWGLWSIIKGSLMFIAPKSEPGDVAEQ
jgi:hypothetical protein